MVAKALVFLQIIQLAKMLLAALRLMMRNTWVNQVIGLRAHQYLN
uniref:Zinc finger protein CONSTANS-LIKE 9-like n=1 Tax=Rhizophora mucronata TaxID=61149 RepID=A0A2P2N8A5_RHIMU